MPINCDSRKCEVFCIYCNFSTEEQVQEMSFGDETGDYSSIHHNFQSVDSKKLNQKLNIEDTYAEINEFEKEFRDTLNLKTAECGTPEYAVIDLTKKREARLRKSMTIDELKRDDLVIYEDVGNFERTANNNEDSNIYELVGGLVQ